VKQYKLFKYRLYRIKSGKYVAEVTFGWSWDVKPRWTKRFISRNLSNAANAYQDMIGRYSQ
jgi:hypothetical protein